MVLFGLDKLRKKKRPPAVHSGRSEFASMSLASASLSAPFSQVAGNGAAWQQKGWEYYDVVPEMRLVVSYRSSALSKVKLRIMRRTPDGDVLQTDDRSQVMLERLFGGIAYHGASLARWAQHLTIVGETFTFVVQDPDDSSKEVWLIVPPDHVQRSGSNVTVKNPFNGEDMRFNVNDVFNFRLWEPHPHKFWQANSPTRGAISTLDTINSLNGAIRTAAMSRVVGAGVWFLPLELNLPASSTSTGMLSGQDEFKSRIQENMVRSVQDINATERQVPDIVWGPQSVIKDIQPPHRFWSELDEHAAEMRDTEIRRYATGQPLPTEMVTGLGQTNHWTGWQLSEEDLKFDIQPLGQMMTDCLTLRVVAPLMGEDFFVEADYSELVSRPNKTPEALELKKAGALTVNELRETAGYPPLPGGDGDRLVPGDDPALRVESTRVEPPQEIERSQDPAMFAVADVVARDLLHTAGQWLLTHSGRSVRADIAKVPPMGRHVEFAVAPDVLFEAVGRVKPKYEGSVPDVLFGRVVGYVGHLFDASVPYSRDALEAWVSDGH